MSFEKKAEYHFNEGLSAILDRNYDRALKEFTKSLSYGSTARCYVERAKLFARAGDLSNLEGDIKRVEELFDAATDDKKLLGELEELKLKLAKSTENKVAFRNAVNKSIEDLSHVLDLYRLSRVRDQILAMVKPTAMLLPATDKSQPGQSKLGGLPDLPRGHSWPVSQSSVKLTFIGQLNFAEAEAFCKKSSLPTKGILYFFYDIEAQVWGSERGDKNFWHALYIPDFNKDQVIKIEPPKDIEIFDELILQWQETTSLPSPLSSEIYDLHLANVESDAYTELYELQQKECGHQILGYPTLLQRPMEDDLVAIFPDSSRKDWTSLWQIGEGLTDWGDGGNLYLWIRTSDLAKQNFNDVWTIMQCY